MRLICSIILILALPTAGLSSAIEKAAAIKTAAVELAKKEWQVFHATPAYSKLVDQLKKSNSQYLPSFQRTASNSHPETDQRDKEWRSWNKKSQLAKSKQTEPPIPTGFIAEVVNNPCSEELRNWKNNSNGVIGEVFVTDRIGANACLADPTSDYDQGDEAKWQKTFLDNQDFFAGEPERDASTSSYQTQVSILVKDGSTPLGVAVIGVSNKAATQTH